MEPLFDFIQTTGGKITGFVVSAILVIIIIAWVDKHPTQKPTERTHKEPRRDDEI